MGRLLAKSRRPLALVAVLETEVASEHLHPYAASVPLLALFVGVLAWRRRLPFLAVLVGFAAMLIAAAAGVSQHKPFSPILVVFVALYSLALYATPRRAAIGLVYAGWERRHSSASRGAGY